MREELQETHPCFQNRVFLEPPKQLEEGTETSTSCSESVEEAFENSAPQPNVVKGVPKSRSQAELLSTGSTGEPLGSWIEHYIVYESGSPCGVKCHALLSSVTVV